MNDKESDKQTKANAREKKRIERQEQLKQLNASEILKPVKSDSISSLTGGDSFKKMDILEFDHLSPADPWDSLLLKKNESDMNVLGQIAFHSSLPNTHSNLHSNESSQVSSQVSSPSKVKDNVNFSIQERLQTLRMSSTISITAPPPVPPRKNIADPILSKYVSMGFQLEDVEMAMDRLNGRMDEKQVSFIFKILKILQDLRFSDSLSTTCTRRLS